MHEIVRVLRVIEYEGPRSAVGEVVARSVQGERRIPRPKDGGDLIIRAATIGQYPQFLHESPCEQASAPAEVTNGETATA